MTSNADRDRTTAALRALDPAPATTLTVEERRRADALLAAVVATPPGEPDPTGVGRPRGRARRRLVPAAFVATGVDALTTALGGGPAFADWSAVPVELPASAAAAAATTCRLGLDVPDRATSVTLAERRGGWTYVLLDGGAGEAACLMPDHLVGASGPRARRSGFFGSYDSERETPPTPARDGLVETESIAGTVSVPGRLPIRTVDGVFVWVTGYAGSDVTRVTVDPPVGPDVVASLADGRFAAWWPAGEARGGNPGLSGAWSYTVTLTDGTTRRV